MTQFKLNKQNKYLKLSDMAEEDRKLVLKMDAKDDFLPSFTFGHLFIKIGCSLSSISLKQ